MIQENELAISSKSEYDHCQCPMCLNVDIFFYPH